MNLSSATEQPKQRDNNRRTKRSTRKVGHARQLAASLLLKTKPPTKDDELSECEDEEYNVLTNITTTTTTATTTSADYASVMTLEALRQIANDLQRNLPTTEKKLHPFRRRPDALFSGYDLVSYLVHEGYAGTTNGTNNADTNYKNSRIAGLALGRRLGYECALFEHVDMDHDLIDDKQLWYRFTPGERREVVELCREAASCRHCHGEGIAEEQHHQQQQCSSSVYDMDYIAEVFEEGVEVGPHVFHYRTYRDTFVGRDAVSFLVRHRLAKSRQDAVRVGNLLFERGVFRHCTDDHHGLKDKFLFYRFVPHAKRRNNDTQSQNNERTTPVEALAVRFKELVRPNSDPHHPFRDTFCGSSAVDAMIRGRLAATRFEAVAIGQRLAEELRLFRCVYDAERPFMDNAHTYYQYNTHDTTSLGWLRDDFGENGAAAEPTALDDERSQTGSLEDGDLFDEGAGLGASGESDCVSTADPPKMEMSAFNKSMKLMEEEEDNDDLYLSGLTSVATVDHNSSVVDALLSEDSTRHYDRYGFAVETNEATKDLQSSANDLHKKYAGCDLSEDEWGELLNECSIAHPGTVSKATLTKLKHAMRLGLSDCHRQKAWTLITGVDVLMPEKAGEYEIFVKQGFTTGSSSIATYKGVIERDLHRTFPRHILFSRSNNVSSSGMNSDTKLSCAGDSYSRFSADYREIDSSQVSNSISTSDTMTNSGEFGGSSGPDALRRILYAYSIYDPEVGYCQGMNFIAAMFLTFMSEEESFWMLVAVMNEEPYYMRTMFLENMAGTHKALYIVDKLIKRHLKKLAAFFQRENIEVSMFATQWIMTVFTSTFSFELVARVWDIFLVEGWKVVYRVIIALLEQASSDLMELTMEETFDYFRDFPSKVDGQGVILASLNIPMKNKLLRKYGDEWERSQYSPAITKKNSTGLGFTKRDSTESNGNASSTSSINMPGTNKKTITKKIVPSFVLNKLPIRSNG